VRFEAAEGYWILELEDELAPLRCTFPLVLHWKLAERFPKATAMLSDAGSDILAFTTCPRAPWKQIWSINPQSV
jgi:transposase-like protein